MLTILTYTAAYKVRKQTYLTNSRLIIQPGCHRAEWLRESVNITDQLEIDKHLSVFQTRLQVRPFKYSIKVKDSSLTFQTTIKLNTKCI